jgi:threonylcarbamoyladenosine tRNA methylthiotransferase MtaB
VHEREHVADHVRDTTPRVSVGPARARHAPATAAPLSFGRTRALLKVQDGCDAFCTYCVVPYVRGRDRSVPMADAVAQARRLVDAGFHEIVITGADLGSYGRQGSGPGLLPELVRRVLALGGSHRIRLSSIEPNKVDPEIVSMMGAEPRLCRHLHLPLQSGSDAVLEAMRRPYRAADYGALLERIAARGPVAIGADVIVGFPGEGDREFEETMTFLRALPLASLHVFRYSPRPGTVAARQPASLAASVLRERARRVRELGEAKRAAFLRSLIGSRVPVLAEAGRAGTAIVARSDFADPVLIRGAAAWSGFRDAWIRATEGGRWTGSLAEEALG